MIKLGYKLYNFVAFVAFVVKYFLTNNKKLKLAE